LTKILIQEIYITIYLYIQVLNLAIEVINHLKILGSVEGYLFGASFHKPFRIAIFANYDNFILTSDRGYKVFLSLF